MKHIACQHTAENESACESCEYFGIIPKVTYSTIKDFGSFMNSVSHIDISPNALPSFVTEIMIGLGFEFKPLQKVA
jgi:hypothetical protein